MRSRANRRREDRDGGFSLIELIVTLGIIGVLAAIAVPSFVGLQAMVHESSTRSDLSDDRAALVAYGIDNNGSIPTAPLSPGVNDLNLVGYGWSQSVDTKAFEYRVNAAGTAWCLQMTSVTDAIYRVSTSSTLPVLGTCAALTTY